MNRRDTILALLALGVATESGSAHGQAQRVASPRRIGFLPNFHPRSDPWFAEDMQQFGWTEGGDYTALRLGIELNPEQIESAAKRIVAEKPDLIFAATTAYALAAYRLTATIPIVMFSSGYPIEAGIAHSLARPGKNVTGNTTYAGYGIWGKLIQLLRDAKPIAKHFVVLWGYVPPAHPREEVVAAYSELRQAENTLGVRIRIVEASHVDRLSGALAQIDAEPPDALVLTSGLPIWQERQRVARFAIDRRLPTILDYLWPEAEPYPLMVYAPSPRGLMRSAVSYIDRILKGARPGDLPIQQPARFDLVINLKTAKALGITIPQSLLLRADKVIE